MLHAHTHKRDLVWIAHPGLSISYDRVLQLPTQKGNNVCKQFQRNQVVCPPQLSSQVFCTAVFDNIDHNPSLTTARDSFHGMAISLLQHPSFVGEGADWSLLLSGPDGRCSKTIDRLPGSYTEVNPVTSNIKVSRVPETRVGSLTRDVLVNNTTADVALNISWAAFHASRQPLGTRATCSIALLPLLQESAHTVAMIKYFRLVFELLPGEIPNYEVLWSQSWREKGSDGGEIQHFPHHIKWHSETNQTK